MNVAGLTAGAPETFTLSGISAGFTKRTDVQLVLLPGGDEVDVIGPGARATFTPASKKYTSRLRKLRADNRPRLCWVAGISGGQIVVQVHTFAGALAINEPIEFGVDERIVDRVRRFHRGAVDVAGACDWLAENLLIEDADQPAAIATGDPDGGRFRLLGAQFAADIRNVGGKFRVERVVSLRGKRRRPPETLLTAEIQFVDATLHGALQPAIQVQLDALSQASDGYFALWARYQVLERETLAQEAERIGFVRYSKVEPQESGAFRCTVERKALADFVGRLDTETELEAGAIVPPVILGEDGEAESQEDALTGKVTRVENDFIEVRPSDEWADVNVLDEGYLFPSLAGDNARLGRRDEALKRMSSADSWMPQLGLIIEGLPAPARRLDLQKAMSPAARAVFRMAPTSKQRDALDVALNTPDIALIQGPPGTGKTTVLAALQRRLAEMETDDPGIAGRVLLTSFQHDAVDNAVARTNVFGLPPARIGGKRGHDNQFNARDWASKAADEVRVRLIGTDADRPRSDYEEIARRVASLKASPAQDGDLQSVLADILALPVDALPAPLWEQARALRRGASSSVDPVDFAQAQAMKAARGIRTQAVAFEDDGPRRAHLAIDRLASVLTTDEVAVLEAAAATPDGAPFDRIDVLGPLRDSLIDRLQPKVVPGEGKRFPDGTLNTLNAVVTALYDRMCAGPLGAGDALEEYANTLAEDHQQAHRTLHAYSMVYAATCQQAVSKSIAHLKGDTIVFDHVVIDEAARANPLDLLIPLSVAKRRVVLVGDHRQLPHLLEPMVERAMIDAGDVIEAGLRESLFERLYLDLKARGASDGFERVVTLDQQFRMHPTLGDFVSEAFYPDGERFGSPRPASDFAHGLKTYSHRGQPLCAAWIDVPLSRGSERRAGTSWARPVEAEWIASEVRGLIDSPGDESIGVITFYRGQVDQLMRAFESRGLTERDLATGKLRIPERLETRLRIGTVDAFQGREFDVVFVSMTRSNAHTIRGDEDDEVGAFRRKYGHLLLPNRLCVAMSRQRKLLVMVGDRAMVEGRVAERAVPGLNQFLKLCGGAHGLLA